MKLWLLASRPDMPWPFHEFDRDRLLVRATTEDEARRLASDDAGGTSPWSRSEWTSCREVRLEGQPGVVMMEDF